MPVSAEAIAKADREYHPCWNGLHVCGQICDADGERPLTLANVPYLSLEKFRQVKATFALGDDEDFDLLIDWFQGGSCEDQFAIRRQTLDAVLKASRE